MPATAWDTGSRSSIQGRTHLYSTQREFLPAGVPCTASWGQRIVERQGLPQNIPDLPQNTPDLPQNAPGPTSITNLVALLICLAPTTIGALLSAIGIAGMSRLNQANVLAMSGRAIKAAGEAAYVVGAVESGEKGVDLC